MSTHGHRAKPAPEPSPAHPCQARVANGLPAPLLTLLLLMLWLAAGLSPAAARQAVPRFLAFEAVLQGSGDAELRWPVSVAAGPALEIAVADAFNSRLVIFSAAGGWTAEGVIRLPAVPLAVVHDGRRYVVALRGRSDLVTVDDASTEAGPESLPLPAGTVPGALAAAADAGLLVYDAAAGRVLALDDAGRPSAETPVSGSVTALAAAVDGGFYAVFADRARVTRYDPGGRVLGDWQVPGESPVPAWPGGIVVEPTGGLLLTDLHAGRVVALDAAGRLTGVGSAKGWKAGRLLSPAGITRLSDGRLVIADRGNGRVQIFRNVAPEARKRDTAPEAGKRDTAPEARKRDIAEGSSP